MAMAHWLVLLASCVLLFVQTRAFLLLRAACSGRGLGLLRRRGEGALLRLGLRRDDGEGGGLFGEDDDGGGDDDDFGDEFDRRVEPRSGGGRQQQQRRSSSKKKVSAGPGGGLPRWEVLNRAVIAGIFVAGIGTGVTIDSAINTNPKDLASRDAIDRNAPNPKLCATYGSSAMVLDERVFITFNPFNVYVTQADTKPGCVLRPSNVVAQLQKERQLITDDDVTSCKNGYNTWAFVGDIDDKPQLNCVFQSDDAQNEFLSNPKIGIGEDIYDRLEEEKKKTVVQQVSRLRPDKYQGVGSEGAAAGR